MDHIKHAMDSFVSVLRAPSGVQGAGLTVCLDITPASLKGGPSKKGSLTGIKAKRERLNSSNYFAKA